MFEVILDELRESKYYSISVDSTPDISHIDQLSFCIRYVMDGEPIERFLQFIPIKEHKSEYLAGIVMSFLEKYGIPIADCRGQSYDNANNMAGRFNGLQARILNENDLAKFLPCAAHSLCLVGKNAVTKNSSATDFFNFVESLYLYFVHSTYRWDKLKEMLTGKTEFVLKRSTGTRWSAKYLAINALWSSLPKVISTLIFLQSDDCPQTEESKCTARSLLKKLCKFETIFVLHLWHSILQKFDKVNISLQKMGLELSVSVKLFNSLEKFLETLNSNFDSMLYDAEATFNEHILINTALSKLLESISKTRKDNTVVDKNKYRNDIFLPIVKSLLSEIKLRSNIYKDLYDNFHFMVKLNELRTDEIAKACKNVSNHYKNDISASDLSNECEMAKYYFFQGDSEVSHASMYAVIVKDKLTNTFPNIEILLRIYLCFFVTNVTDERSFSKLKYNKNYMRNSMANEKLNNLSLCCIERKILQSIDYDDIIDTFARAKSRKTTI